MKKLISFLLLAIIVFSLPVSVYALSPKAAYCQKNIDMLDDVATLDSLDDISSVSLEIFKLSEADANSLDLSKLQSLSKQLLDVNASPVHACAALCQLFDAPTDMKIFGEVFYAKQTFPDGEQCYYYQVYINSSDTENKPCSWLCVATPDSSDVKCYTDGDENYFAVSDFIAENTNQELFDMGITLHMFTSSLIADVIGCEYVAMQ